MDRPTRMRLHSSFGLVGVVCLGLAETGCPNPSMYQTPRTTPAGRVSHSIALEGARLSGDIPTAVGVNPDGTPQIKNEPYSVTYPMLPTYQLRVGLHDRVDLGIRIANLSSLGADVKYNFLRTKNFDLAIDPGIQASYYSFGSGDTSTSTTLVYGHFPVVMGINVSEGVTIVPTVGATYIGVSNDLRLSGRDALLTAGGFTLRGSLGVQFRPSKKFALHPEVTVMRLLEDVANTYIVFGLGFNFGAIPAYDDLRDGASDDEDDPEPKPREERKKPVAKKPPPPPSTPEANGAPPPVVANVEPTAPNSCKTTCTPTDSGALPPADGERVAATLEPMMRELRACLDRIGGQSIRPAAFLRYTGDGPPSVKLELSGYEDLACAKEASARHPVRIGVSRAATLRCEARCN